MKQYLTTWMSLLLILTLMGCGGRGHSDLLEARLRQQEDSIFALQRDLKESQHALDSARHQSEVMSKQLAKASNGSLLPEQTKALYKVTGVKVNSLLTGGVDLDSKQGDELWTTVVTPHDADGETVKLPADFELELVDLNQPEENRRVGLWTFDSQEVRSHWYSGFAGSGFRFELPWQTTPHNSELTLVVRMKSPDGRIFNTTSPLKIAQIENTTSVKQAVSRERLTAAEPARISFDENPAVIQQQSATVSAEIENPFEEVREDQPAAPSPFQADDESPFRVITDE
ncbi:hypothetical protein [Gimesia maris]|uniref:hypothetical protein n=1 Tax=Gimesia maris TaxID=122 RepID=UPI00241E49A7|nr:hypothetical protein [Gimesia maris]|tara:strand:- start:56770 stop:57627 length:858 start_codon:yes stop_codon:yes gene_type:complete